MRKFGTLAAIILCIAAIVSTACTSNDGAGSGRSNTAADTTNGNQKATATTTNAAATPAGDGIQRITVAEARKAVDAGRAVFVDVRSPLEFEKGHIKGSLSLPKGQIAQRAGELPKDKLIITYCA
jgi:3-mercaptopyruvate sulfurtransferase SseA